MKNVTKTLVWRKNCCILGTKIQTREFRPGISRDGFDGIGTSFKAMNTPLRVSKGYASQVKYAVLMPLFFFVFCFVL